MNEEILNNSWKRQGGFLAGFLVLLIICYYPTYSSMVAIWARSENFTHGFLIVPICLWLIWQGRSQIKSSQPQVNYLGVPILLMLGFLWLAANYVGVLMIEQFAATLMISVLVFTLLGWQVASKMAFPLMFLLFAVPIGEELTPTLINFTANFTVSLIKLTGIPIYREGNFFQLPTGDWSVVAACSGVRYLIASVTLGVLFAYLNYRSWVKRSAFVLLSIVVPIIANGLRAFLIVMIGHFSNMELATGVDHLIYGWVFFGMVIAIMFYVGSFWRDDDSALSMRSVGWQLGNIGKTSSAYVPVVAVTAVVLVIWPVKILLEKQELDFSNVAQINIEAPSGWGLVPEAVGAWKPSYHGLDREFSATYRNAAGAEVILYVGYYVRQRQDAELGNYNNVLVEEDDRRQWKSVDKESMPLANFGVTAPSAVITGSSTRLLITYFYYVDSHWLTNKYVAKLYEARARLMGRRNDGAIVTVMVPLADDVDIPVMTDLLQSFLNSDVDDVIREGLQKL